jgi:hypothetical protein
MIMQYAVFLSSIRLLIGSCVGVVVMYLLNAFDPDKTLW